MNIYIKVALASLMMATSFSVHVQAAAEEKDIPTGQHALSNVDRHYMHGQIREAAQELQKHQDTCALAYKAFMLSDINFLQRGAFEFDPTQASEIAAVVIPELQEMHNANDPVATRLLALLLIKFPMEGSEDTSPESLLEHAAETDPVARYEYARLYGNKSSSRAVQIKSRKMVSKDSSPAAVYLFSHFYRDGIGIKANEKVADKKLKEAAEANHPEALFELSKKKNPRLLDKSCLGGHGEAHLVRARIALANANSVQNYNKALQTAHDDLAYATRHGIPGADFELFMIAADNPFLTGAALAHSSIRSHTQDDILFLNINLVRDTYSSYVAGTLLSLRSDRISRPNLTTTFFNNNRIKIDTHRLGTIPDLKPGEIRYFKMHLPRIVADNPAVKYAELGISGYRCSNYFNDELRKAFNDELRKAANSRMKALHEQSWKWTNPRKLQFQWNQMRDDGPVLKGEVCNRTSQPIRNLSLEWYIFDANANLLWRSPMDIDFKSIDINQWTDFSWYVPLSIQDMDPKKSFIMASWE